MARKKEFEGGGVLINQAFHTLDLMVYLCGKVKSVQASMKNYSLVDVIDVEDTLDAYINFENGAKGIFYAIGDLEAAKSIDALFYPIIAGEEEKSWEKLYSDALDKFFDGKYAGEYEKTLIDAFYKSFE